jgi:hypothetical protein
MSPYILRALARTALFAAAPAVCMLFAASADAAELNVSGTWNAVYHCEAGSCAGEDFPANGVELVQAAGSTHVQSGPEVEGTLNDHTLTLAKTTGSYRFSETVTVSADGNSWSGPLSDSNGTSGTDTATRVSGGSSGEVPPPTEPVKKDEPPIPTPKGAHGTGITVLCNYDELTSQDTCTATVADTYVSPTGPSGSVTFTSPQGGLFAFGRTCSLASSASAPSTASCSVQYLPPTGGGFPSISASYAGDATHAPSSGATQFILPGGTPISYDTSNPGNGPYPNEILVEVKTPVPGTEVRASLTKGDSASPAPGKTPRASEDADIIPEMRTEVEERDREQRYPDIVPEMRKEVEEREIAYEADVAHLRREINEAKRQPAGLSSSAQAEENASITGDVTVIQQINQQESSPALKADPASQAALAKLAKQKEELQLEVKEALRIGDELTGRLVKGLRGGSLAFARIAKAHPKLVTVGLARRVSKSGTTSLKIPIKRATLIRLLRGKRSAAFNLRVSMTIPSSLVTGGVPLGTVRQIKLGKSAAKHTH